MCINSPFFGYPGIGGNLTDKSLANIPYMPYLPMATCNIGGDIQVVPITYTDSNSYIQFSPLAQMMFGISGLNSQNSIVQPNLNPAVIAQQTQGLLAPTYNNMASQNINMALNTLNCVKSKLDSKLNDSSTTAEMKTKIQELLKEVEAKIKEAEELKKSTNLDPSSAYSKSLDLLNSSNSLARKAGEVLCGTTTATTGTTNTTGTTGTTTTTGTTNTTGTTTTTTTTGTTNTTGTTGTVGASTGEQGTSGSIDNFSAEIKQDVEAFFNAIDGWFTGTDNDVMEGLISKHVQAGTLTELMLCWNQKASARQGESFIEAFMNDADHGQAKTYLPYILESLTERAKALGVCNEEFEAYRDAADKEIHSDGFWGALAGMDDDVVCENIDAMLKMIADAAGSKYGEKKVI